MKAMLLAKGNLPKRDEQCFKLKRVASGQQQVPGYSSPQYVDLNHFIEKSLDRVSGAIRSPGSAVCTIDRIEE